MKYRSEVFKSGPCRVRVSYRRRHWFFRWELMGVEVWTPTEHVVTQWDYVVYKAVS